jgi:Tfp pilus assembly protein PilF
MFFLKVVDAQIEFVKDASGAVTALVLHQGGRDQKAPRISDKAEASGPLPNSPQTEARSQARVQLNKGVQAFKSALYPAAVECFKTAVNYDPTFATARLYLATAYMQQYIPGADSPENMQMATAAYDQFQKVLAQDPKNELAVASIASLLFNEKKLDDANASSSDSNTSRRKTHRSLLALFSTPAAACKGNSINRALPSPICFGP